MSASISAEQAMLHPAMLDATRLGKLIDSIN